MTSADLERSPPPPSAAARFQRFELSSLGCGLGLPPLLLLLRLNLARLINNQSQLKNQYLSTRPRASCRRDRRLHCNRELESVLLLRRVQQRLQSCVH